MTAALLELTDVCRVFPAGGETVAALSGINLSIRAGEFVAIVGASGSGKSTLMNILGGLDVPSRGDYRVDGRSVAALSADARAALRREHFGFIFQRYHLLGTLSALENVAMPAVYAGLDSRARHDRARMLLERLGLGDRLDHRPNQLSGGQQQRVSIARALMNGGQIILADEPTGALDRQSGQTVLEILRELHADGHTVIIVTHDLQIAETADRVIEISDGRVRADRNLRATDVRVPARTTSPAPVPAGRGAQLRRRLADAIPMALRSMAAHRVRTALTMLGIVIGIAAVVSVVGLGEGSRRKVLAQISELGASTLSVFPGRGWDDEKAATITSLVVADAEALAAQSYVGAVTPWISGVARVQSDHASVSVNVNGVGEEYFRVNGLKMLQGRRFLADSIAERRQEVVLDDRTAATLFPRKERPIGRVLMVERMAAVVVGVVARPRSAFSDKSLQLYMPYTCAAGRLAGPGTSLAGLTVRVRDGVDTAFAERAVVGLLQRRHGLKDFFVFNSDQLRKTLESASRSMSLLISAVAVIALIVGGIGVMNIMLVSVSERTREIGLRMAVGARRLDILLQFLIESICICVAGSFAGIAVALGVRAVAGGVEGDFPMVISAGAILAACLVALVIGLAFGFLPARNAARLEPVDALSRE